MSDCVEQVHAEEHLPEDVTNPVGEWHPLWWCVVHAPGDMLRYLYFMRFSLLLWLSMPAIAVADMSPAVATVTRGVLTPFSPWQWVFTGFAVVLPGWFALLAARIVCSYGAERFKSPVAACFVVYDKMEGVRVLGRAGAGADPAWADRV